MIGSFRGARQREPGRTSVDWRCRGFAESPRVTRWGLSETLGTIAYGENQDEVFLGYQVARRQNVSEETSRKIDAEIERLVEVGYAEAERILATKRADLETLAKGLLEFETLS